MSPLFRLTDDLIFPPPEFAEPDGLLAVGGDLSPERLLLAYSMGIFPWFNEGDPLLWWSPDPRCIIEPGAIHVSRSLAKTLKKGIFNVTIDRAFGEVIAACSGLRREGGTWITPEMTLAYKHLYDLGYAHSVECWHDGELAGGLYGVCLGRCFFGESMFHRFAEASKVALVALCEHARTRRFELIDCQLPTPHLKSMGAREVSRDEFLRRLRKGDVTPLSGATPPESLSVPFVDA